MNKTNFSILTLPNRIIPEKHMTPLILDEQKTVEDDPNHRSSYTDNHKQPTVNPAARVDRPSSSLSHLYLVRLGLVFVVSCSSIQGGLIPLVVITETGDSSEQLRILMTSVSSIHNLSKYKR